MSTAQAIKPVVLIILDGVGATNIELGNAVTKAPTPFLEMAWDSYPHSYLQASEEYVGLPKGICGNSEVGHSNLGSGRVLLQSLPRINKSISTGEFRNNPQFLKTIQHAKKNHSTLHLAICFSDAGVHGTIDHLIAMLEFLSEKLIKIPVVIHAFTDGRDSPPKSASIYFDKVENAIKRLEIGEFGSIMGRIYAMDRNRVWDRTQRAYELLTQGKGSIANNWNEALQIAYGKGQTDEFIEPILLKEGNSEHTISNGDSFIFMNYRADRALEISQALINKKFSAFKRKKVIQNLHFVGMTKYAKNFPENVAFPTENVKMPIGRLIAERGYRQLRIAESEKFPHVTYFFNGGRSVRFNGEDRIELQSPRVGTYDQQPSMNAFKLTDVILEKLNLRIYDFIVINFANGDMVGHTGNYMAGLQAMQTVDICTQKIVKSVRAMGGISLVTADHGNIEEMINIETKQIDTEHSVNPVPFILVPPVGMNQDFRVKSGILADITPTILNLMNISKPSEMTGSSLII